MSGRFNWRQGILACAWVLIILSALAALVHLFSREFQSAFESIGNAALLYLVSRTISDEAHLHNYAEVTRTYRNGELTSEHRKDFYGRQSGRLWL